MNCTLLSNIIDGPRYNCHYTKKSMISIILSWNEISDVTPFLRKEGRHLDYSTRIRIYLANFYCGMNSQNWNYARKIAWTHLFCTINFFLSWRNATSKEFCNLQNNFLFQEFFPLMREYKLDFATLYCKWELRDHPFKTSVFFRGGMGEKFAKFADG